MSQLQDLARCLLAAGYVSLAGGKRACLLSTSEGNLISKHWMGDSFEKEELIATSIRPNSSAAILVASSSENIIIGITADSTLAAFEYNEDEEEWMQDHALSMYKVHPQGRLSACYTHDNRICIVFQDLHGDLVRVEENDSDDTPELPESGTMWTTTLLKGTCEPTLGTPLFLICDKSGLHIFYVSSADQRIHRLHEGGVWVDEAVFDHEFGPLQSLAAFKDDENGVLEIYALTKEGILSHVSGDHNRSELGRVDKDGGLVPSTTAECCFSLFSFATLSFHIHAHVQKRRRRICW